MSWFDQLQPASYNGVPFAVLRSEGEFGRRQAIHEYPFRDTVWVEDLGRAARRIEITGFIIGDDVIAQKERMIAVAEQKGAGQLVHPTLGLLNVSLLRLRPVERFDHGRYFELNFSFVEAGLRIFPASIIATGAAVLAAALGLNTAASADFATIAQTVLTQGPAVAGQAAATVTVWNAMAQRLANDATNLQSMISTLPGDYGRYFSGRNNGGFATPQPSVASASATIDSLITTGTTSRANVAAAAAQLTESAINLSISTYADFTASVQQLAAALLAATVDPADGVRLLSELADFTPHAQTPASQQGQAMASIQTATGDLCRRAAVVAVAQAATTYQPSSYDDAADLRTAVCDLLDNEITIAGDEGQDSSYNALRTLRVAVVQDLTARGANLARIVTFTFPSVQPSLTLANRIYRDASREDQLITQVDPIHPAFMPNSFQALAD